MTASGEGQASQRAGFRAVQPGISHVCREAAQVRLHGLLRSGERSSQSVKVQEERLDRSRQESLRHRHRHGHMGEV